MDYIKVCVKTIHTGIDIISDRLLAAGVCGFQIEDEQDFNSFLEDNTKYWDYVDDTLMNNMKGASNIIIYVSDDFEGKNTIKLINSTLLDIKNEFSKDTVGHIDVTYENIKESDWANNWKQYFHPIELGEKVVIVPEWEEFDNPENKVVFKVDPGMTFGTGSHATTQLCIKAMENYISDGQMVLDLGCGSGILSIIAILLGAKNAVGVDIDENAVNVAYENAERNNVDKSLYTVYDGDITSDNALIKKIGTKKYDIVLANIVADVIIAIAPVVGQFIKDDGVFIVSGIIGNREQEVVKVIEQNGFCVIDRNEDSDWVGLCCKLK